jgi:hypothetical protein
MSTIFRIDSNNGFRLDGGMISRASGIEAVAINCQHEVQTILGEDPFRKEKGMPNFRTVWNGTPDILQFEFFLRKTLLAVQGVDRVSNFKAEVVENILTYSINIETSFGSEIISGIQNA